MAIPDTVSFSEFRANMASYLDHVHDDSLPLVLKRRTGERFVIMTEAEYNALDETAYLLSTAANRKALLEAINEPTSKLKKYKSADEIRKEFDIE